MNANNKKIDLYVAINGCDQWSGSLSIPLSDGSDGPMKTIEGAKKRIGELRAESILLEEVKVWIRGGRYELTETVEFTVEDNFPVTYSAFPGEMPIIDGGVRVNNWSISHINNQEVWVADLPEVASGKLYFKQLFVNGNRRERARLPKKGYYWIESVPGIDYSAGLFEGSYGFVSNKGDIRNWENINDVEIVTLHYWIEERMPIKFFDEAANYVESTRKSIFSLKDDFRDKYAKYYVENVFEALTEPGEWYLNRSEGKLFYVPYEGENFSNTEVVYPIIEQFIRFSCLPDKDQTIESVNFRGITFQYSDWHKPFGGGEHIGEFDIDYGASPQGAYNIPGVIYMKGAKNCSLMDCVIRHIGWYGIELDEGCSNNHIIGNEIFDMGAGGIKISGAASEVKKNNITANNTITDNHIYEGGKVFYSGVGILSRHSANNYIAHNHIHDLYYTGISCGWVWGYGENISKGNIIEKNHIHHLGKGVLNDMGGIYTLGVQPGTIIRGNLIHHIEKSNYGGWAIYTDEGSSCIVIENNICHSTSSSVFNQHYGKENIIRNNIFAFGDEGIVTLGISEEHQSFVLENNLLVADDKPVFIGGYGCDLVKKSFLSNWNLLWDISRGREVLIGNGGNFEDNQWKPNRIFDINEWKGLGYDCNSKIEDPIITNKEKFYLEKASPAFNLGFKHINIEDVGVRKRT